MGRIVGTDPGTRGRASHIVFVVTDDQDAASIRHMPILRSNLMDEGITFRNAFVTNSLCCPARATILRGQYTHNHGIEGNGWPSGGFHRFRRLGHERSTVATWLNSRGYRTALVGKYLNDYKVRHVPRGWDKWYGITENGYRDFKLNENGRIVSYKSGRNYLTDLLTRKARGFVRDVSEKPAPFFLYLAPYAPHAPATPAGRHEDEFRRAKLPRLPSFDEHDVSDKPGWVRNRPRLTNRQERKLRGLHKDRLRSLQTVDEMVGGLVKTLRANGELGNTYIVFTSDHGYHMGQHRLPAGKWTAYEENIRVPAGGARSRRAPWPDPAAHGAQQRFRPDVRGTGRGHRPRFRGRTLAGVAALRGSTAGLRMALGVPGGGEDERSASRVPGCAGWEPPPRGVRHRRAGTLRSAPRPVPVAQPARRPGSRALREGLRARLEALDGCAGEECRDAEK